MLIHQLPTTGLNVEHTWLLCLGEVHCAYMYWSIGHLSVSIHSWYLMSRIIQRLWQHLTSVVVSISASVLLWMLTQLLQQPDKITRRINWAFILSITGEFEHLEPSLHVPHSTIEDYPQYLHLIRSSNHGSKLKIPAVMKEEILFFRILSRGRIWLSILAPRLEDGRW